MRSRIPREGVMLGNVIELLIYHQPGVKPSLTLHPFGVPGYVAGHSLTVNVQEVTTKTHRTGLSTMSINWGHTVGNMTGIARDCIEMCGYYCK